MCVCVSVDVCVCLQWQTKQVILNPIRCEVRAASWWQAKAHGTEGRDPADKLYPLTLYLSALYYSPPFSISLLSIEEKEKKKGLTAAEVFKKKDKKNDKTTGVKSTVADWAEWTKTNAAPASLPVSEPAVIPFWLCLPLFLIIKREWAHSRKGHRVIIKAYSSV